MSKRALLVGIDHYTGNYRDQGVLKPLPRLYGCVRDAAAIGKLLQDKFQFTAADLVLLPEANATQGAIQQQLETLVDAAQPGDQVLFYFSGHGSQYCAASAPGGPPQPSFEVLCPADMDWDQERFISAPYLKSLVDRLHEQTAWEIVIDACDAGGINDIGRTFNYSVTNRAATHKNRRDKFLTPPQHVLDRIFDSRAAGVAASNIATVGLAGPRRCIVWASSAADQPSEECVPDHVGERGAFSYFFETALKAQPGSGRRDLLKQVQAGLAAHTFYQVPQLSPASPIVDDKAFLEPGGF